MSRPENKENLQLLADQVLWGLDSYVGTKLDAIVGGVDHYEKIYPYNTVGATIVAGAGAWGATVEVIPIDAIVADYGWNGGAVEPYVIIGHNLISKASPTNQVTIQLLRVVKLSVETLDVNSGLGEANPDRVFVPDTSFFAEDDYVWVVDDDTLAGEIGKIASIVENDYLDLTGGLAALYSIAQNAKVYLVRRNAPGYHSIWTSFSAASTKEMQQMRLHAPRDMASGDGVIGRAYGVEAAAAEVYATIVYHDIP